MSIPSREATQPPGRCKPKTGASSSRKEFAPFRANSSLQGSTPVEIVTLLRKTTGSHKSSLLSPDSATRSLKTQNRDQLFKERICSLQSKFLATEQHPCRNSHPVKKNNRKSHKYIPFTGRSSAITIFAPPPTQDQVQHVTTRRKPRPY